MIKEWVKASTQCYDPEHPGPGMQGAWIQWYESPFAIETTYYQHHMSTVREYDTMN